MRGFLLGIILVFKTAISDWTDPCTILHQRMIASGSFGRCKRVSQCLDTEMCSEFDDSISTQMNALSCNRAFEIITRSISQRVETPPIVASRRVYATPPNPSHLNLTEKTTLVVSFLNQIERTTDRIVSGFPRLVYVDEHDGDMLRDLVARAKLISSFIRSDSELESQLTKKYAVVKWRWAIRMINDYIKLTDLSFAETELMLISVAPFVHAFLHVAYYLPIFANTREMFYCIDNHLIMSFVKYHPLYTLADDDGVWYIRLHDLSSATFQTLKNPDEEISFVTTPNESDLSGYWGTRFHHVAFPRLLYRSVSRLINNITDKSSIWVLKIALFTIKYLRETGRLIPDRLEYIDNGTIENLILQRSKHPELLSLMMMLRDRIDPTIRLDLLVPLSNVQLHGPLVVPPPPVFIESLPTFEDKIEQIMGFDKFELRRRFEFETIQQITPNTTETFPHNLTDYFRELLAETFDPSKAIFTPVVDPGDPRRFKLDPRFDHDFRFYPMVRRIRIVVGRLIGLVLRDTSGNLLIEYLPQNGFTNQTVLETIFFNSHDIRSGFYDVYHAGTLERIFANNGSDALRAFHGLSRTRTDS